MYMHREEEEVFAAKGHQSRYLNEKFVTNQYTEMFIAVQSIS